MKKLFAIFVSLLMLTACKSDNAGESSGGRWTGETTEIISPFTLPVRYRTVYTFSSPYSGIEVKEQKFNTDDIYIGEELHNNNGISEIIVKKISPENNAEVFCYKDGCTHDSVNCPACNFCCFTLNGELYSLFYDFENSNDGARFAKSDGYEKALIGKDDLFEYGTTTVSTDGTNLFYFVINGKSVDLRMFDISKGTAETVKVLYEESGNVTVPFESGETKRGSIVRYRNMNIEYISSDGNIMVYSLLFSSGGQYIRLYASWNISDNSLTYLNADENSRFDKFVFTDGLLFRLSDDGDTNRVSYKALTGTEWSELHSASDLVTREVTAFIAVDNKVVINLYSDSWIVDYTSVVIDISDMSVGVLTHKCPAYCAKYYRAPDIFYVSENDLIVAVKNNGAGKITFARISKDDYFSDNPSYAEIGTFNLM